MYVVSHMLGFFPSLLPPMLEFDEKYFNSTLDDNTSFYVFPVEQIRGIKNLLFYSLPERKEFYPEVSAFSTYFIE